MKAMNSYLEDLKAHLSDIPADEVNDLVEYYHEYFIESEMTLEEIKAKYGNPKQFATKLKLTYFLEQDDQAQKNDKPVPAKSRAYLVWLILLGFFASPLLVPLALAVVLIILSLLITLLALLFSLYVITVSLVLGGLFSLVSGLGLMFSNPQTMLVFSGFGLLIIGLGILMSPFVLQLTKLLFNRFVDFVKWLGRKFAKKSALDQGGSAL